MKFIVSARLRSFGPHFHELDAEDHAAAEAKYRAMHSRWTIEHLTVRTVEEQDAYIASLPRWNADAE